MLVQSEYMPTGPEAEVGNSSRNGNLTQEHSARRPNIDSVWTTTIYISFSVALDTIGNAAVGKCKQSTAREKWLPMAIYQIECITAASETNAAKQEEAFSRV
jgi:hypothetical protein